MLSLSRSSTLPPLLGLCLAPTSATISLGQATLPQWHSDVLPHRGVGRFGLAVAAVVAATRRRVYGAPAKISVVSCTDCASGAVGTWRGRGNGSLFTQHAQSKASEHQAVGSLSGGLGHGAICLTFICAQASLNLYMKYVMAGVPIAAGVRGVPASFLVTGLQQLVSFCLFLGLMAWRRRRSSPQGETQGAKRALTDRWRVTVLFMSAVFACNMGLNNLSLAFIPLSVNQVIRACTPLVTALLQLVIRRRADGVSLLEWLFMVVGVACAAVTVVARTEGCLTLGGGYFFGACLCVASSLCAALDLVLKQWIGTKTSSVDAIGYMALPSFCLLLLPGTLWSHPVPSSWAALLGSSAGWTDAAVLAKGLALQPSLWIYILLSGVLAFGYNVLTTSIAVRHSATAASLLGNLPTSTLISLLLLERNLPRGAWCFLLWGSILGNVLAFFAYSVAKRRRQVSHV